MERPPLRAALSPFIAAAIAAAAWLFLGSTAAAQQISAQVASRQCYVGEPLRVTVTVSNFESFDGPSFEPVEGLEIRRLPGEQTSMRTEIVNGRVRQQRTIGINFEAIPARVGGFTIPAFTVVSDGKTFATDPIPVSAVVSETGDLMVVRVSSTPQSIFVGQRAALMLEVAVKVFRDRDLGITLDEGSMWMLLDRNASSWGAFGPTLQKLLSENRRPRGESRIIGDTEYIVFTIVKDFDPIAAGEVQLGDIRIRMEYPLRLRRGNDFFFENRLQLGESRPISATPSEIAIEVRPVPEGGRPSAWNGAVGRFEVVASALPTEVNVGDPITLTLRATDLSAASALDGLQSPDLALQPAFASGFRVPRDAAAGSVEARSKVFTQSIRALSDAVTEIPPIEFAYFDPEGQRFETVRTAAIPIKVRPSTVARLEVDADTAEVERPSQEFTRIEGGLLANASVAEMSRGGAAPMSLLLVPAIAGPASLALAVLWRKREEIDRRDPARRRARGALRAFERRIDASERATDASTAAAADAVSAALLAYLADRFGSPEGSLTRGDAMALLDAAGAEAALRARVDAYLRQCERARYSGERIDLSEARAVARALESSPHAPRGGMP